MNYNCATFQRIKETFIPIHHHSSPLTLQESHYVRKSLRLRRLTLQVCPLSYTRLRRLTLQVYNVVHSCTTTRCARGCYSFRCTDSYAGLGFHTVRAKSQHVQDWRGGSKMRVSLNFWANGPFYSDEATLTKVSPRGCS